MKLTLTQSIRKIQREGRFPVISEIKVRSKKDGDLLRGRDPLALAGEMAACPVAGISVVTEPRYFRGSMALLREVAAAVDVPVLRKDFITTEAQIETSARNGASAVLLIAALLKEGRIEELIEAAKGYGLETLVEAHTVWELRKAQAVDSALIGINNRDIRVLEIDKKDVGHTEALAGFYTSDKPLVSESSIACAEDVRRAAKSGAHAVLVGTALMTAADIPGLLSELTSVGWPA